jgi:hypothetical protein
LYEPRIAAPGGHASGSFAAELEAIERGEAV